MKRVIIKINKIDDNIDNRPIITIIENENNTIDLEYGRDNVLDLNDDTYQLTATWAKSENMKISQSIFIESKKENVIEIEKCLIVIKEVIV